MYYIYNQTYRSFPHFSVFHSSIDRIHLNSKTVARKVEGEFLESLKTADYWPSEGFKCAKLDSQITVRIACFIPIAREWAFIIVCVWIKSRAIGAVLNG